MRKSLKTLILIVFNLSVFAQNQPLNVDGIVAAIGDQIILKSDIIFQKQALSQEGKVLSDCDMLKEISLEKLLIHHAAIDSVEVTNEEIDESIDRRIQQLVAQIGSERKMEEYYKKINIIGQRRNASSDEKSNDFSAYANDCCRKCSNKPD
jgi:peptidyl-prolyl cis-trans isomerase SurA